MIDSGFYKLKMDYNCPDYHVCTVYTGNEACQKALNETSDAVSKSCTQVGTTLIGYQDPEVSCGWKGRQKCFVERPSGVNIPGPERYVLDVQSKANKGWEDFAVQRQEFYHQNQTVISIVALGVALCCFSLIKRCTRANTKEIKGSERTQEQAAIVAAQKESSANDSNKPDLTSAIKSAAILTYLVADSLKK